MIIAIAAGRIARDAELRTTKSETSVCSFTVACDAGYGDKKRTEWVKVALFGKRADGLPLLKERHGDNRTGRSQVKRLDKG